MCVTSFSHAMRVTTRFEWLSHTTPPSLSPVCQASSRVPPVCTPHVDPLPAFLQPQCA
jgi:hypothetical protein